jgi:uncharacterized protein
MGNDIIHKAEEYVRSFFASDFSGHDNDHTMRVYRTACRLAEEEGADMEITALAALLHDVDDRKISPETSESKLNAENFLKKNGVPSERCERILQAVKEVSFEGTDSVVPSTIEGKCVQDADRLDALGAVGIGRTFAYGGSHQRRMHDPDEAPAILFTDIYTVDPAVENQFTAAAQIKSDRGKLPFTTAKTKFRRHRKKIALPDLVLESFYSAQKTPLESPQTVLIPERLVHQKIPVVG